MIERATTRTVSRATVCTLGLGMLALAGCGGGSGGSPPLIATSTSLTASPVSAVSGATVTLAAAVEYAPAETASGTVDFLDGSTVIGSSSLDPKGVGLLKIATLAVGSHSITAAYLGNSTTSASTSSAIIVSVRGKGASAVAENQPVRVALSHVPETATYAIAAAPGAIGCAQSSSVLLEAVDHGRWRLSCKDADTAAAEKTQSLELVAPGNYLLAVAPRHWFIDSSGQPYIVLSGVPQAGDTTETTP